MPVRINPTRMNLINVKKNIKVASKGHDLLKRKREVLVVEFMKLLKLSGADRDYLDKVLKRAYSVTAMSSAYAGDFELNAAASNMQESTKVEITIKNVMGVKVPEISATTAEPAPPEYWIMGTGAAVDDVDESFAEVKKAVLEMVKREQGLKRLVLEIEKTKRRVNALEYVLVPRLEFQSGYIKMRLEEMERDTFSALKHVKRRISK
ncbi:MAG: V-type ATP synthase subunit D [Candidatus Marsarchaeota archaeon]|nr:V-type ATP synthase subunit D [Candidatus Marsarchaeota archaeon]